METRKLLKVSRSNFFFHRTNTINYCMIEKKAAPYHMYLVCWYSQECNWESEVEESKKVQESAWHVCSSLSAMWLWLNVAFVYCMLLVCNAFVFWSLDHPGRIDPWALRDFETFKMNNTNEYIISSMLLEVAVVSLKVWAVGMRRCETEEGWWDLEKIHFDSTSVLASSLTTSPSLPQCQSLSVTHTHTHTHTCK